MNNLIFPCLWFDGNAKDAADFYCSVFDASRITQESPVVIVFELDGFKFMALNGGPKYKINPSISFFVNCGSEEEVEVKWAALSQGGTVMMPLDKYPWSEKYGFCQDRFGVNWQVMLGSIMGQNIVPALMFTQDQAGKAEDAIGFYTGVFDDSETVSLSRYEPDEPDVEGTIKHGLFKLGGQYFVALDSSAPHDFRFDPGVSLVVECDTQDEIDYYWENFTAEGEESRCGWLIDKYGVSWQILPSMIADLMSDPEKAERVTQAFMNMNKLDIDILKNA